MDNYDAFGLNGAAPYAVPHTTTPQSTGINDNTAGIPMPALADAATSKATLLWVIGIILFLVLAHILTLKIQM